MIRSEHRFHGRSSLRFVYRHGRTVRGQLVSVRYALNERRASYRVAVVVSRKVSKSAVKRNRIRRRVYEIIRNAAPRIAKPYDIVISVYGDDAANMPAASFQKTVLGKLEIAGVLPSTDRRRDIMNDVLEHSGPGAKPKRRGAGRKGETPEKPARQNGEENRSADPFIENKEPNK